MSDDASARGSGAGAEGPLSRRRLMVTGGAAAVGAAAVVVGPGASPAAADPASSVTFTPPSGSNISATNVQDALVELDGEKAAHVWWDVRRFGVSTANTDNTTQFNTAGTWVAATGGGTLLVPPGTYTFAGTIVIPKGVDIWGTGGHVQTGSGYTGSVLLATASGAQVVIRSTGGQSGNLIIDGGGIANPSNGLLHIDFCVERMFSALLVVRSAGNGVVIDRAQNNTFTAFQVSHCAGDSLVIDKGAGGNAFLRNEFNAAGGANVRIRETRTMPIPTPTPPEEEGTYLNYPQHNYFLHCVIERGPWETGANAAQLHVSTGADNHFTDCIFALHAPNTSSSGAVVILTGGEVTFEHCGFSGDSILALRVTNAGAFFLGRNSINVDGTAVEWNGTAYGNVLGRIDYGSPVTTKWSGSGSHANLASWTDRQMLTTLEPGATYGFRIARQDEPSGIRFQVSNPAVGAPDQRTEIQVSDGSTYNAKARWRLQTGGIGWETPDDVQLVSGASLVMEGGALGIQERTSTPGFPAGSDDRASVYVKSDRLVVAFRQGATIKYRSMLLSDTTATWTYHGTTPP